MPSVKLALDHVNEHDSVLRNYRLHMWWNDTEVSIVEFIRTHLVSGYYNRTSNSELVIGNSATQQWVSNPSSTWCTAGRTSWCCSEPPARTSQTLSPRLPNTGISHRYEMKQSKMKPAWYKFLVDHIKSWRQILFARNKLFLTRIFGAEKHYSKLFQLVKLEW